MKGKAMEEGSDQMSEFERGYEFAAGRLLSGKESELNSGAKHFDRNDFDLGMEKAVRDWSTRPKEGFKVLDKISLKEILDKFIACATNREEISQAIFQTFGVPALPSVEEIDKAIDKVCIAYNVLNLSNANGTVNTIQQALSDAIIAAFQKARGEK